MGVVVLVLVEYITTHTTAVAAAFATLLTDSF